jgi:hypothetical protein
MLLIVWCIYIKSVCEKIMSIVFHILVGAGEWWQMSALAELLWLSPIVALLA